MSRTIVESVSNAFKRDRLPNSKLRPSSVVASDLAHFCFCVAAVQIGDAMPKKAGGKKGGKGKSKGKGGSRSPSPPARPFQYPVYARAGTPPPKIMEVPVDIKHAAETGGYVPTQRLEPTTSRSDL